MLATMKLVSVVLISLGLFVSIGALSSNSCPDSHRITECGTKCENSCPGAKICCKNVCGFKSCTDINLYQNNKGSQGGSSSKYGATGTYCGNVKCSSGQKCELDRTTKRQTCVRA